MTEQAEGCLFCRIVSGEIPSDQVYQDEEIIAFRDISPQAPLHVLIIPREHIATLNDLEERHAALTGRMMLAAKRLAAREGLAESGYRLVINCNRGAGQTVFHIHMHLLGGRALTWPPG